MTPQIVCIPLNVLVVRAVDCWRNNVSSAVAAIEAVGPNGDGLAANIVLLPQFALTGSARSGRPVSAADLEPLRERAESYGMVVAGADVFEGQLSGFLVDGVAGNVVLQPAIGDGEGSANVQVITTDYGRIACLPGDDILHAEYVRLAVFGGAEVILNPCVERTDHRSDARRYSRGARAWESHVVVAMSSLGEVNDEVASSPRRGCGAIWDSTGQMLAEGAGETVFARYDLAALRQRRAEPWVNFPAQLRSAIYAEVYEADARAELMPNKSPEAVEHAVYDVLLMQSHQLFATGHGDRDEVIQRNLDSALGMARVFAMQPSVRLIVFPEFFLQGSPMSVPPSEYESFGIRIPGPEIDQLAQLAKGCSTYVCGAVLEYDPDWPGRFFNTAFILAPNGEVILRYRKLQCADLNGLLAVTTPGNVYSAYVEQYGFDALIPVVDTSIGRLGSAICFDSNWPELWRAMGLKGADVICNPTSEVHSARVPYWYQAKQAHAAENWFYVASANAGSEQFASAAPVTHMNRGHSCLIDFNGKLAACADGPGTVPLVGRVDLNSLRRAREQSADDPAAQFRSAAVAKAYREFPGFPLDIFLNQPMGSASEGPPLVVRQIQTLIEKGIYYR